MKSFLISMFIRFVLMSLYAIQPIVVQRMKQLINAAEAGANGELPKREWVLKTLRETGGDIATALKAVPQQGLDTLLQMLVAQYFPSTGTL